MKIVKCIECDKCGNLIKLDLAHTGTGPASIAAAASKAKTKPNHRKYRTANIGNNYKSWTTDDDQYMHNTYRTEPLKSISKKLDRTQAAVKSRASYLGINRRKKAATRWGI